MDLRKKFGGRFKSLRIAYGFTQPELIQSFKIKNPNYNTSIASISQYENGKRIPEIPDLIAWAKYFNVTTDYLLGISDVMFTNVISSIKDLEKTLLKLSPIDRLTAKPYLEKLYQTLYKENIEKNINNINNIKILGQTAAGQPIEYGDNYAQDIDNISDIPNNADYALIVNGDSMEPDIKNGQLIYIKNQPNVENGEIAVVEIDGAVTCKKVFKWNNHIELHSINKKYEPIILTSGNFKILGKVIF